MDLCNHVIAKTGFYTPEDFGDSFKVMEERGAFDQGFSRTLLQMARFPNRLEEKVADDTGYRKARDRQLRLLKTGFNLGTNG